MRLGREWQPGDCVDLALDLPVRRMAAHPNIESCRGKVALQRGPIVYGFERLDNGGNTRIMLDANPRFQVEHRANILGGVTAITGRTREDRSFTAIPFYALANRAKSSPEVWAEQDGLHPGHRPAPNQSRPEFPFDSTYTDLPLSK